MWGVILVLGLCVLGVYDENGWFFVAAGLAGSVYFIIALCIAALTASITSQVDKLNKDITKVNRRTRDSRFK